MSRITFVLPDGVGEQDSDLDHVPTPDEMIHVTPLYGTNSNPVTYKVSSVTTMIQVDATGWGQVKTNVVLAATSSAAAISSETLRKT